MQHYTFSLSRPGLKPGCYIPLRLRVVDTVTILSSIPMVIMAIGIAILSLAWAEPLGLGVIWRNQWAFLGYAALVLFLSSWTLYFWCVGMLRCLFRFLGMMTREEATCYPLEASKKRIDPWPECWQKSENGAGKVDDSKDARCQCANLP
jgi:hypothetical protein